MEGHPLALDGSPASIGLVGRWLCQPDDVVLGATDDVGSATGLALKFPRNWPAVFKQSAALKALINRELKGTRCRVISSPPNGPDANTVRELPLHLAPLHSFSNAEQVAVALPDWQVVKGFLVYERTDAPSGDSFVAVRHWWSMSPTGTWLDFTPPLVACSAGRLLLVESKLGEKRECPLTAPHLSFALALAAQLRGEKRTSAASHASGEAAGATADDDARATSGGDDAPPADAPAAGGAADADTASSAAPNSDTDVEPAALAQTGSAPSAGGCAEGGGGGGGGERAALIEQPAADAEVGDGAASGAEAVAEPRKLSLHELRAAADEVFRRGDEQRATVMYGEAVRPIVAAAVEAKERGNVAFKSDDAGRANEEYESALALLDMHVRRFNYFADQVS